ncbi:flagellar protein FlaG [Metabacillus dongyingensis]|uniref:flagellar protein FlaG n=1 Tax=Metabacillus dongyingensis TaxID=2874282 RepID=UPI001CBC1D3A|nr:flagellar protein FlaG [Metabacillus dongyingensis]UAL51998.1 flagellar protein FlaG [Metabacillus dongyingensis]
MMIDKMSSQPGPRISEIDTKPIKLPEYKKEESIPAFPKEELEKVVNGINDFLQPANTHIQFQLHEKLNEYYVTVVDNQTREIVREIPSKKMLDLYAAMTEFLGFVVDKKI